MRVLKHNPRKEYRLKQRELIEASPLLSKEYPRLKTLKVVLEYFDASGVVKNLASSAADERTEECVRERIDLGELRVGEQREAS